MEAALQKQVVGLRALGKAGDELKNIERNLAAVQTRIQTLGPGSRLNSTLGDFFKQLPLVGGAMNVFNGSAAAMGTALTLLTGAVQQTFAAMADASALVETANQLGLTSTAVQSLGAHFGDAGIKAEQWQAVSLKLSQSLAQAAAGSQPLQDAFAALGLDIAALRALRPDEALAAIGRALAATDGSAAATAASYQLLGEQVGRLKNSLIDLGQKGVGEVERSMLAAGRATEDHLNKRLEEAQRRWDALMQRVKNTRNKIAAFAVDEVERLSGGRKKERLQVTPAFEASLDKLVTPTTLADLAKARATLADIRHYALDLDKQPVATSLLALADTRLNIAERRLRAAQAKTESEATGAALAAAQDADIAQQESDLAAARYAARQKAQKDAAVEETRAGERNAALLAQIADRELAALPVDAQRAALDARRAEVATAIAAGLDDQATSAETLLRLRLEELTLSEKIAALDRQKADAAERAAEHTAERALSQKLAANAARLAKIEADPLALNATKDAARLSTLLQQNHAIAERIALLEREQALTPDPTRQDQLDALRTQQAGNDNQIDTLNAPPTITQGALAGVVGYLNSIPTAAQRAQASLLSVAQAMEQGIGTSLRGLLDGTLQWGDALANIANSIVNAIINSFVGMVAQWITQQIVMAVAGNAIRAAQLAALAPVTLATTAMWMPAATAASIATMGGAAVSGTAAAQTAIAASMIPLATGGYVTGPGTGTSDSIAAWLSNGEYVMPAAETARYRPLLDSMRDGDLATAPANAAPAAATEQSGSLTIHHHFTSGVTRAEVAALIPEIERRTIAALRDRDRRGKA